MNYSIFIRTYKGDYPWLKYCLRSIRKHAPNAEVLVVSPDAPPDDLEKASFFYCEKWNWVSSPKAHDDGYIDQQISKLFADATKSAYVLHIDSDTVLTDDPAKLFIDGKPQMLRTPYAEMGDGQHWKSITEKHLGWGVSHEYMRRLPLVYPVALYGELRRFLESKHGKPFAEWARSIQNRELSEFNLLGAYAFEHMHDAFTWIDTDVSPLPPLVARQFWSWGGITPDIQKYLDENYPA